jgi:esterase FrsA
MRTEGNATNDIGELKRYVGVHARGQQIPGYAEILGRIRTDADGPGSWVGEWSAEAERLADEGRHLEACRHFIMARFPFVDGPARRRALERAVASFDRWRPGQDIHRLEADLPGGRVGCWQTGLSAGGRRPLLLLMGGNVSVKEQWAPALPVFRRLGMAAIVADMPQCGENPLPYDAASPGLLSGLMDAVAGQADVSRTYAIALSFSGHLALRAAVRDPRIKGIVTVGAPVRGFFTDESWQARVPRLTTDTLAHMTGLPAGEVYPALRGWALTPEELAGLTATVGYVASGRDEIIPPADPRLIRERVRRAWLLEHDDVHAAPDHVRETQLWSARCLLRMRGASGPGRAVIELMWQVARWRGRHAPPSELVN